MLKSFFPYFKGRPFLLFLILNFFLLGKLNLNSKIIGWDTTDAFYINFLFLVDCIRNWVVPAFNHYTLGGVSFLENLITSNTINLIDFVLATIAQVFSPLYIFQLQYTLFGALSSYWIFKSLTRHQFSEEISFLGGFIFGTTLLPPLIGQAPFYYSLVFISFLLGPFLQATRSEKVWIRIFIFALAISLMVKGYFFLIAIALAIAFVENFYRLSCTRDSFYSILKSYLLLVILYFIYTVPSYLYLQSLLPDLVGNFISPEPRLRSLAPPERFYYSSLGNALLDVFDGRFNYGGKWTLGLNSLFGSLFVLRLIQLLKNKRICAWDSLFIAMFLVFALLSAGYSPFKEIYENLPLIKANRWGFGFIYFSQMAVAILALKALLNIDQKQSRLDFLLLIPILLFTYLILQKPSLSTLLSLTGSIFFVWSYYKKPSACINVVIIFSLLLTLDTPKIYGAPLNEWADVKGRVLEIDYDQNIRDPGKPGEYEYWDRSWFYKKIPTMNGYNNAVHPIFWYLKGNSVAHQIFIPLCSEEIWTFKDRKPDELSDNLYLERSAQELTQLIEKSKCANENVTDIELTPTTMKFRSPAKFTIILHNTSPFIWLLKPKRERILLGGMRLIENEPLAPMELRYDFVKIAHYSLYLLILLLGLLFYVTGRKLKLPKP